MGAGAGYTIFIEDVDVQNIVSATVESLDRWKMSVFSGYSAKVVCDIKATARIKGEGYYDGCDWIDNVPITITSASISLPFGDGYNSKILTDYAVKRLADQFPNENVDDLWKELENNIVAEDINLNFIQDCLDDATFEGSGLYGGGWSHTTFDGNVEIDSVTDSATWSNLESFTFTIDHQYIIDFIDKAVTGDNKEYEVVFNGDGIDGYVDQDDAIKALNDYIRDEILENGIDSIDWSHCYIEELYWTEDVDGNMDFVDPWYDNIVYTADPDDFDEFADTMDELHNESEPGIGEDFDI